jgi:hypothetical protein
MLERDCILVNKAIAGDPEVFGDLVERYNPLIHGLLLETIRTPLSGISILPAGCRAIEERKRPNPPFFQHLPKKSH